MLYESLFLYPSSLNHILGHDVKILLLITNSFNLWHCPKGMLSVNHKGWKLSALRITSLSVSFLKIVVCSFPLSLIQIINLSKWKIQTKLQIYSILVFKHEWKAHRSASESSINLTHHTKSFKCGSLLICLWQTNVNRPA